MVGYLRFMPVVRLAVSLVCLLLAGTAWSWPLTLAVASNFRVPAEEIAERFTAETGHEVRISSGSTGKLFAQIVNGAPFAIFLAADSERPRRLEQAKFGVEGTRATYAVGRLVLWSRDPELAGSDCRGALQDLEGRRLAIANPETAPYGAAARDFLRAEGIWDVAEPNLVFGESIAQTLHFVATGNAQLGLVARSQVLDPRLPEATCRWTVPAALHAPIEQQAIKHSRTPDDGAADEFLAFLRGATAREIISRHGYEVPQ